MLVTIADMAWSFVNSPAMAFVVSILPLLAIESDNVSVFRMDPRNYR